jgi:NAD(P)-dependent dehydrogenase (short-subunit alcohol dehydrogenase family)
VPGGTATAGLAADPACDGRAVLAEIRCAGATAALFDIDLADPYACAELFDRVEETLGSVEILVDNAAYKPAGHVPAGRARHLQPQHGPRSPRRRWMPITP